VRLRGSAGSAGDVYLMAAAGTPPASSFDPNPDDNHGAFSVSVAESLARQPAQVLAATPGAAAAAGDLDGDGFDDLLVATAADEPVLLHLNVDDPTSLHEALRGPGDSRRGLSTVALTLGEEEAANADVVLTDIDGDGVLDAVLANGSGHADWLLLGNGDGSAGPAEPLGPADIASRAVAAGDLMGNGLVDLVFASEDATLVYANDGNGRFAAPVPIGGTEGRDSRAVAAADFSANGLADVVVAEADGPVRLYRNLGSGRFERAIEVDPGPVSSLAAADLDGDGLVDLVLGRDAPGASGVPSNTVYLNDGTGGFRIAAELGAAETAHVLVADLTGNGALDIVTINAAGAHQIHAGDGQGGFALHPRQFLYPGAAGAAAGRFQRDGHLGLAVSGAGGTAVFFNDGRGNLGLGMTDRPVIELLGAAEVAVTVGEPYEDAGASARDASGEPLDPAVDNPVNTAVVGTYRVTYTAIDAAGNAAEPVNRVVRVDARTETSGGGGGATGVLVIGLLLVSVAWRASAVRCRRQRRVPARSGYESAP
jgi:hypothetical protein